MSKKNPFWKIILTDIAGIMCLIAVPFLGPLPGPGGIPLLIAGLGLLSVNHERPKQWLEYAMKHSESLRHIVFPNKTAVKWAWDLFVLLLLAIGTWINIVTTGLFFTGISIGVFAVASTIFMMNRERIVWFDKKLRRK